MIAVTVGTPSVCAVCGTRCSTWWRGRDFYAAVHEGCAEKLMTECPILRDRASVATEVRTVRRGAYARRAGRVPDRFVPSRFPAAHDAWLVLAETITGQVAVPCGGDVGHGVAALRSYRLLTETGQPIMSLASSGRFAVGGALFTPEREVALSWGYVPVVGAPAWEPLRMAASWGACSTCDAYVWPGRWITAATGQCVLCAGSEDRTWPREPDFPGEEFLPSHLRDDVPARVVRKRARAVRYSDDHA